MKKERVKTSKAEVYTIENFLSDSECEAIISAIEKKSVRSTVSGGEFKSGAGVSNFRTSSTASIKHKETPLIMEIDKRISRAINIPLELGEVTQGQKYEVGQQFKDHTDYFGPTSMKGHGDKWGNRTWTFMIYLNDDCEGGETEFKKLGIKFQPKKGMAVAWRNMSEDGKVNPNTLHAGRPVKEGVKYIITKWFREYPTGAYPLSDRFKKRHPELVGGPKPAGVKVNSLEDKVFSGHDDFPTFTEKGFKLIKVPKETWSLVQDTYNLLKDKVKPERFRGLSQVIYDKDKKNTPVDILDLGHVKSVKSIIHNQLKPVLEEWAGEPIIPSMMYGIRSYKKGAILKDHKDRPKTHHISAIIIVDRKGGSPWALDIQDHDGKWHKVFAEPGDMILYESAACQHGRLDEFDGEFFRNFFVHYQLRDWNYVPKR